MEVPTISMTKPEKFHLEMSGPKAAVSLMIVPESMADFPYRQTFLASLRRKSCTLIEDHQQEERKKTRVQPQEVLS
jgi:hypothetical protein